MSDLLPDFRVRYPAFAAVPDATVQIWLDDGEIAVSRWPEEDQDRATMLFAAHHMASQGLGTGSIAAGVTSFKSGTFSATVSDAAASRTGYKATVYGREFLDLMRSFAGPRLAWTPPTAVA